MSFLFVCFQFIFVWMYFCPIKKADGCHTTETLFTTDCLVVVALKILIAFVARKAIISLIRIGILFKVIYSTMHIWTLIGITSALINGLKSVFIFA